MTSGAQQACPDRYVQLRILEERNTQREREEPKKEEQVTLLFTALNA